MKKYLIPFLFSVIFFIISLSVISDYGINWDTPARLLRGQAYLNFYLGEKAIDSNRSSPLIFKPGENITRHNFLTEEGPEQAILPERPLPRLEYEKSPQFTKRQSFYDTGLWGTNYFFNAPDPGHLPLPEETGALFNRILWTKLGLLGDIESYKVAFILISSVGVFITSLFAFEITGSYLAAIISGLSLGLYPLFFSESHFNLKDPIQASFFAGSVWAFMMWVKQNKKSYFWIFVMFAALAASVKWNIIFLPFILLPWLFMIRKTEEFKRWFRLKRIAFLGVLGLIVTFLFMVLIWPTAWQDPVKWIGLVFNYYFKIGFGGGIQPEGFILPGGFNTYPILLFLTQTPEIILALATIGVYGIFKKRDDHLKVGYLILFWLLVPLIKASLPNVRQYGGLRQIIEFLPALAILAGSGVSVLGYKLKNIRTIFNPFLLSVFCYLLLIPIIKLHPNENVYFNSFAGGVEGAEKHHLIDRFLSYGNVYKQAGDWLNKNTEKDANIALIDGFTFALSPMYLRPDISISPNHFSGFEAKGEYILLVKIPEQLDSFGYGYPARFLKPVHEIKAGGVTFLSIYKNSPDFLKDGFKEQLSTKNFKVRNIGLNRDFIEIDLGGTFMVTKITLENVPKDCQRDNNFAYIDEIVNFSSEEGKNHPYSYNERKLLGESVEYYFPAESARYIRIYPKTDASCFLKAKIGSISYLAK